MYFSLEDNRFTMLCWFLPYINMNQPWVAEPFLICLMGAFIEFCEDYMRYHRHHSGVCELYYYCTNPGATQLFYCPAPWPLQVLLPGSQVCPGPGFTSGSPYVTSLPQPTGSSTLGSYVEKDVQGQQASASVYQQCPRWLQDGGVDTQTQTGKQTDTHTHLLFTQGSERDLAPFSFHFSTILLLSTGSI